MAEAKVGDVCDVNFPYERCVVRGEGNPEFYLPCNIAIAPDTSFALAFAYGAESIQRIDLATGDVTREYRDVGFRDPRGAAFSPDGSFALITNHDHGNVAQLDLATGAVSFPYTGLRGPMGVAVSPGAAFAVIGDTGADAIGVIDLATGKVTPQFVSDGLVSPIGVAISPDGSFALVANYSGNNVGRIDFSGTGGDALTLAGGRTLRGALTFVAGVKSPVDVAISPDGSFALVSSNTENCIARLDLTSNEVSFPFVGSKSPRGLDISSDGCFALFTTQAEEAGNGIAQITLSTVSQAPSAGAEVLFMPN